MDWNWTSAAIGFGAALALAGVGAVVWYRLGGRPRIIQAASDGVGRAVAQQSVPSIGVLGPFIGDIAKSATREALQELLP